MNITLEKLLRRTILLALYSIAFFMSFKKPLVSFSIIILAVAWALSGNWKQKAEMWKRNKILWLVVSFYLLHVVGILYTEDIKEGLFDLQVKLSILVLPLVLSSTPLTRKNLQNILMVFLSGCIFFGFVCLGRAFYLYYFEHQDTSNFFYINFSIFVHPSYYAMYLCLAISILFVLRFENTVKAGWKRFEIVFYLILLALMFFVALLSSKTGLISLFVIFLIIFLRFLIRKQYKEGLRLFVLMICFFLVIVNFLPVATSRFKQAAATVNLARSSPAVNSSLESTGLRLMIFKSASEIIKENYFFGIGTGDVNSSLSEKYTQKTNVDAKDKKLNAHNAFLQVMIALGSVGLLVLICILSAGFYRSIKERDFILLNFILLLLINFMTESMLETQAGVVFFSFFLSLLVLAPSTGNPVTGTENGEE
jgi:O-antigen ligase